MNSAPDGKATEPANVLTVRADEAHAYQQVASADYQKVAPADEQPPRVTKFAPTSKATEPDDVLIARVDDDRLAHAHQQLARADEQLAHVDERLSRLEHDVARHPSAAPGHTPPLGGSALRGLVGLLLAASIFVAAFDSQSSHGDAAKQMIAQWAPQLVLISPPVQKKPGLPMQPSPSADQVAVAEPITPQSTASAQTAPQEAAPTTTPLSADLAQVLQTRARDLANVEQEIEQLKTSQEQLASDNAKAIVRLKTSQEQMARDSAKAIEQLKTSQEQMVRDNAKLVEQLKQETASFIAKASQQNARPKSSVPPPRPIATPAR